MFVYALDQKIKNLPNISRWLNPNYSGDGDLIIEEVSKSTNDSSINIPKNFQKDFPNYVYQFPQLIQLKNKLNQVKKKLEETYNNAQNLDIYQKIINYNSYGLLKRKNGILCQEYNAEIVSNAWLKMYENMSYLEPYLKKIEKGKDPSFNSFHIAEAPGNFILAINHYMNTNFPKIEWNWLASTYIDLYSKHPDSKYLDDTYGMIKKYPDNWIFGADGDGDITSVENLLSFQQTIIKRFKNHLNFITSDVKYISTQFDFSEEENINIPVHLGHLLCSLLCLDKGGIMMLKEFTFFEAQSVSFLYIMNYCFDKLLIVKPESSRSANSEVYIIGFGYKQNLSEIQISQLLKIMNYIRTLNTSLGSPSIFLKDDIPNDFVEKIIDLSKRILVKQIPSIQKNYELFKQYENNIKLFYKDNMSSQELLAKEWIEKNKVKKLDSNKRLL